MLDKKELSKETQFDIDLIKRLREIKEQLGDANIEQVIKMVVDSAVKERAAELKKKHLAYRDFEGLFADEKAARPESKLASDHLEAFRAGLSPEMLKTLERQEAEQKVREEKMREERAAKRQKLEAGWKAEAKKDIEDLLNA
ncbi:MAG: hypothetical protein FWD89_04260 [Firmicutes bacterium]|nr:hypothetical protein [Bacillota bacterium]